MKIIVQKYGGTSVSTEEGRRSAATKIIEAREAGYKVVAVVSAMGRKGAPYATDTLLSLLIPDQLTDKRDRDMLMSCGETISSVVMADLLLSLGVKAHALTGFQAGILTDDKFSKASCIEMHPGYILKMLEEDITPIVAGFQGISENGDITTLGRGGSDTTASLLGGALHAERVEIYTDVDGIMTADPRVVKDASVIDEVTYEEVFQMANQGAKVIHPRAVEAALDGDVPLVIKNNFSEHKGTIIKKSVSKPVDNKVVSNVACMKNRTQVIINRLKKSEESRILEELAKNGVSIDLINIFTDRVVFTIDEGDDMITEKVLTELEEDFNFRKDCAKVTAIGAKMHGVPGVMSRIVKALLSAGCEIYQSSDSHMHISCLVKMKDAEKAVKALHSEFQLMK